MYIDFIFNSSFLFSHWIFTPNSKTTNDIDTFYTVTVLCTMHIRIPHSKSGPESEPELVKEAKHVQWELSIHVEHWVESWHTQTLQCDMHLFSFLYFLNVTPFDLPHELLQSSSTVHRAPAAVQYTQCITFCGLWTTNYIWEMCSSTLDSRFYILDSTACRLRLLQLSISLKYQNQSGNRNQNRKIEKNRHNPQLFCIISDFRDAKRKHKTQDKDA